MIKVKWIYDWFKESGEEGNYVDGIDGMTGKEDLEEVVIDGRFNVVDLADYLNNKEKGVE